MESQGLGDSIEKFTKATGIKTFVDKVSDGLKHTLRLPTKKRKIKRSFSLQKINMAFKMNGAPYVGNDTPIYQVDMEDGVLGKANNNGTIIINKDIKDPKQIDDVVEHEKVHIDQMKRGDLDYDDKYVYWKGKKYSRASMKEGAKNLPWEKEAYTKTKK